MKAPEKNIPDQTEDIGKLKEQLKQETKARKQLEQVCKENQKLLADAQRAAKIGSWNWNVTSDEVKWSGELFRLLEYNPAEVSPSRDAFLDRVHPDDLPELKKSIETLLTDNKPFSLDHRIILQGGSIRFVNSKGRLEKDQDRKPVLFYGTLQDISQRKSTEEEIKNNEAFLKVILSSLHDHICVIDREGEILMVNEAWMSFARDNDVKSFDKISQGSNYLQACNLPANETDPYALRAMEGIKSVIEGTDSSFLMEYPCSSPTQERWFVMTVVPLLIQQGGAVIAHRDITPRKMAEQQVQQQQTQLAEAQRIAHLGSWVLDIPLQKLHWSDETFRILGFTPQQLEPAIESFKSMIHPDDLIGVEKEFNKLFNYQTKRVHLQYRIIRPDKTVRILDDRGETLIDEQGKPVKIIGTVHDITEFKNAETEATRLKTELAHIDRVGTMDALASAIAHEINQPLAAILSNAQAAIRFLGSEQPDMAEVQEALHDIVKSDKRAGDVIRQIRSLVKKEEPTRKPYQINEIIQNVLQLLNSEFVIHNIALRTDLDSDIRTLNGVPVFIQQVMLNILMNAIDVLKDEPEAVRSIIVSSKADGEKGAYIAITDNGPGIKEKDLGNIFQTFYTTKSQGMGLGLAMSHSIIKTAGGTLTAENCPDGGAKFTMWLPYKKQE